MSDNLPKEAKRSTDGVYRLGDGYADILDALKAHSGQNNNNRGGNLPSALQRLMSKSKIASKLRGE